MTEVRITHLHPRELRERRDACPVAWLPLGTLEWHGRHLPLGHDGVNAEGLCVHAAREIGGVAFPTSYYGDHRGMILEALAAPGAWLRELSFDHRVECCEDLGVSVAGVEANAARDHARGATQEHVELLGRAYWMIRAYGFARIVALAGHGPSIAPAQAAAERFHAAQSTCAVICGHAGMLGDGGGDHAGAWETSQMMYLQPELVRSERLADDRPDEPTGIGGEHPRNASVERGKATVDAFVAGCRRALGGIPPALLISTPDEDGAAADWVQTLRSGEAQCG